MILNLICFVISYLILMGHQCFQLSKHCANAIPDDANVTDDILHTFADFCKQGKISDDQFKNIADASTVDDKIRYIREAVESGVHGAGRIFTTTELSVLTRSELTDFVKNNIDDLVSETNRKAIWDLTDECATCQFKRGDLIEEIFNQWSGKYKNALNLNDLKKNFPTVDFDAFGEVGKELISLKTYHPKLTTERTLSVITKKIDEYASALSSKQMSELAEKAGKELNYFDNHAKVLDFTIKKGEWDNFMPQIKEAIRETQNKLGNVTIRISEF